jgi:hypothetical protein
MQSTLAALPIARILRGFVLSGGVGVTLLELAADCAEDVLEELPVLFFLEEVFCCCLPEAVFLDEALNLLFVLCVFFGNHVYNFSYYFVR